MKMKPEDIERASMRIIEGEMGKHSFSDEELPVVMRVVHATADFDFMDNIVFTPGCVESARRALVGGCTVVTDTNMAASGINRKKLPQVRVVCRMGDDDVAQEAADRGVTRAVVSMERAVSQTPEAIFAVGNAPTALMRLCELINCGAARPALVVGVPVGFVNVVESKEILLAADVPHIVARGRKGGSPVAAAILNALIYGA